MESMKILSAEEMAACDRVTSEQFGISLNTLMQAAGAAVARFALLRHPRAARVLVLCGRGNNGGDGMVAAQALAASGRRVTAILLSAEDGLREELKELWSGLKADGRVRLFACSEEAALQKLLDDCADAELVIDAMVGTGLRAPLRGLALCAVQWLRRQALPVLAVDLPSGWDADESHAELAAPADAVVTFTAPKLAHALGQLTRRWSDPVVVAAIGSPPEAIQTNSGLHWTGAAKAIFETARAADAHKGSFGHVLVAGGSAGKAGAVAMAAMAAMRTGAGLVTAAVPEPTLPLVAGFAPEMMTVPLAAGATALLERKTVLAIGPGLGTDASAEAALRTLLDGCRVPVVIDADGLNLLAREPGWVKKLARGRRLILTPHPGEMARLVGATVAGIEQDRLRVAREYATANGVTLVLKGHRTLVAHADGRVAVNTTGNPGMAKGGSGDILTGMIAAAIAQFPTRLPEAVEAAVCLHGLAGNCAARRLDEHTMLATDTLAALSEAFRLRLTDEDGFVWLQGAGQAVTLAANPERQA